MKTITGTDYSGRSHRGKSVDTVDGFTVIECEKCKFKHIMPLLSPDELEAFYEKKFYAKERPKYFDDMKEDLAWWMMSYRMMYDLFSRHTKGRRLLDVGSGPGHFLVCGKKLGWDVVGVEPSPDAAKYARKLGVNVVQGFFNEELVASLGTFDVIHMSLTLEHIPNPQDLIATAKKMLKPGGLLCIMSPNDYNPFQKILKEKMGFKPWWVVPMHHINYFDFNSAQSLLTRHGFSIAEVTGTFPMEFFLLSGDNYIGKRALGRKCHGKRKTFELSVAKSNPALLGSMYKALAQAGIGREFIVIGKLK